MREVISLSGRDWTLWEEGREKQSCRAAVPGNVQSDLWQNGVLPDPFVGLNAEKYQGLEDRTWWYEKRFRFVPSGKNNKYRLVFEGVDYRAEFFLNNKPLGSHEGMFGRIEFDVTGILDFAGENILKVRLLPVEKVLYQGPYKKSLGDLYQCLKWTVKCQMSYGWDFAPAMITAGVWDDVTIVSTSEIYLEDARVCSRIAPDFKAAEISGALEISGGLTEQDVLQLRLKEDAGNVVLEETVPCRFAEEDGLVPFSFSIANPKLWWPAGYGEPNLYRLELEVRRKGRVLDNKDVVFGIKQVEMVKTPGNKRDPLPLPGSSLPWGTTIKINGREIFYKGANLVPADIFFGNITPERHEALLRLARDGNLNILRIWGGGIIYKDDFYARADRYGIMVWQEFPLGCANHDGNPHYYRVLKAEAESIIKKLRNHACLTVWCGGNELWQSHSDMSDQSYALRMLNCLCLQLDPDRPFIPTTPYPGVVHGTYTFDNFGVFSRPGQDRFEQPLFYNRDNHSAYNETGVGGAANIENIRRAIPRREFWPIEKKGSWAFHNSFCLWNVGEAWLCRTAVEEYFGPIGKLEDLVNASQFLQFIGLQYTAEEIRRKKPESSGLLIWSYNEPWTNTANASFLTYPEVPKPAYYGVKKAFQPLSVSARFDHFCWYAGERFEADVWLLNDTGRIPRKVSYTAAVSTPGGKELYAAKASVTVKLPDAHSRLSRVSFDIPKSFTGIFILELAARAGLDNLVNRYYFGVTDQREIKNNRRNPKGCFKSMLPVLKTGAEMIYKR